MFVIILDIILYFGKLITDYQVFLGHFIHRYRSDVFDGTR